MATRKVAVTKKEYREAFGVIEAAVSDRRYDLLALWEIYAAAGSIQTRIIDLGLFEWARDVQEEIKAET